jgi:hypothetical protein
MAGRHASNTGKRAPSGDDAQKSKKARAGSSAPKGAVQASILSFFGSSAAASLSPEATRGDEDVCVIDSDSDRATGAITTTAGCQDEDRWVPVGLKTCQYGHDCRRVNPVHFQTESHPPSHAKVAEYCIVGGSGDGGGMASRSAAHADGEMGRVAAANVKREDVIDLDSDEPAEQKESVDVANRKMQSCMLLHGERASENEERKDPRRILCEDYDPLEDACWQRGHPVPFLHLARTFSVIDNEKGRFKLRTAVSNMFRSILRLSPEDTLAALYLTTGKIVNEGLGGVGGRLKAERGQGKEALPTCIAVRVFDDEVGFNYCLSRARARFAPIQMAYAMPCDCSLDQVESTHSLRMRNFKQQTSTRIEHTDSWRKAKSRRRIKALSSTSGALQSAIRSLR